MKLLAPIAVIIAAASAGQVYESAVEDYANSAQNYQVALENQHLAIYPGKTDAHSGYATNKHRPEGEKTASTLLYKNERHGHHYHYGFETDNGIKAEEQGQLNEKGGNTAHGGYSYKGDDGKVYTVSYVADENGFKPVGAHLPTPPPIPQAILKSLEQNAKEEAAGQYREHQLTEHQAHQNYEQSHQFNRYSSEQSSGYHSQLSSGYQNLYPSQQASGYTSKHSNAYPSGHPSGITVEYSSDNSGNSGADLAYAAYAPSQDSSAGSAYESYNQQSSSGHAAANLFYVTPAPSSGSINQASGYGANSGQQVSAGYEAYYGQQEASSQNAFSGQHSLGHEANAGQQSTMDHESNSAHTTSALGHEASSGQQSIESHANNLPSGFHMMLGQALENVGYSVSGTTGYSGMSYLPPAENGGHKYGYM